MVTLVPTKLNQTPDAAFYSYHSYRVVRFGPTLNQKMIFFTKLNAPAAIIDLIDLKSRTLESRHSGWCLNRTIAYQHYENSKEENPCCEENDIPASNIASARTGLVLVTHSY